ncbi:hypothetical protein BC938DRAFT_472627 [Jimgerdemannia flammicorona]|uniref:Uncharacterized protein n=1 Tax=Jimgerdemannia flammicorona TaxID=994334 RepID=A0A433Q5Q2_9FUNG|nr:hypothetical protein BC938DRAFT_472627 [Jimgerdemannia flammicorona]
MNPSQWIDVTPENFNYSLDHFVIPSHYSKDLESILIPHGVIMVGLSPAPHAISTRDRVEKLAKIIVAQSVGPMDISKMARCHCCLNCLESHFSHFPYCRTCFLWPIPAQQPLAFYPVCCCILKGGHQFFADLVNVIKKLTTKDGKSIPLSLEFIRVKSYHNDESGEVKVSLTEEECKEFEGKVC